MPPRFSPGATVYAKDGRTYIVEVVDGGTVYCASPGGAETEFPDTALMNAAEWATRADGRRDASVVHLKQSRVYTTAAPKLDPAACEQMLAKAERLSPGFLDFVAFTVARRVAEDNHDEDLVASLSIVKCRALFDGAKPEVRATLVAGVLGTQADVIVGGAKLGDNLLKAMLDKGLAAQADAFEAFGDRPRR